GVRSAKDGCSPQGQCGCCTVLVDGAPRVACVTPVRRIADRAVVTVEGLPDAGRWADAFCAAGASQCGFCTPGIIVRLAAGRAPGGTPASPLANGGAFGGKVASPAPAVARRLADEHGRPVRVLLSREDVVRLGPKRPPIAAGVAADGTGVLLAVRTPGLAAAVA